MRHTTFGQTKAMKRGRSFAWTGIDPDRGVYVEANVRLAREPADRQEAILRHEMGHVVDFLYSRDDVAARLALPEGWRAWPARPEKYADAVAEAIFGDRILYDDASIQTLRVGTWPRPGHLPR